MPYRNYQTKEYPNLKAMLADCAARYGEKPFLQQLQGDATRTVTYRRFHDCVNALGTALVARGLGGRKILVCGEDTPEWVLCYMSVICGVGTVVPVDAGLSAAAIGELADRAEAALILCSERVSRRLSRRPIGCPCISFDELPALMSEGNRRLRAGDRTYLDAVIDENAETALIYTCGSTGRRRGVLFSHRNIAFGIASLCRMVHFGERDVFLSALPLHHPYACVCGMLCPMSRGCTVVLSRSVRRLPADLRRVRPTAMFCVPAMVEVLYGRVWAEACKTGRTNSLRTAVKTAGAGTEKALQSATRRGLFGELHRQLGGRLRLLISFGAGVRPETLHGLRAIGVQALQSYGLAECASPVAINRDCRYCDASAGLTCPDTLLDIFDERDDGIGEIRFRGANVMLGYHRDPDMTAQVLRDGWLYTGDMGYTDPDGFLFIAGRKKNAILKDGVRILPEQVCPRVTASPFVKDCRLELAPATEDTPAAMVAVLTPDYDAVIARYGTGFTRADLNLEMQRALSEANATLLPLYRVDRFEIE